MLPVWMPLPATPGIGSPWWAQSGSSPPAQAVQEGRPRGAHPSQGLTTTVSPAARPEPAGSLTRATISWPITCGKETSPESGLSQSACSVASVTSLPHTPVRTGSRVAQSRPGGVRVGQVAEAEGAAAAQRQQRVHPAEGPRDGEPHRSRDRRGARASAGGQGVDAAHDRNGTRTAVGGSRPGPLHAPRDSRRPLEGALLVRDSYVLNWLES